MIGAASIRRMWRRSIGIFVCLVLIVGCSDSETLSERGVDVRQQEAVATVQSKRESEKVKKGQLQLGADAFELNVVVCLGSSTATAIASDSQKRTDYPVVTTKIYDPAMSGGLSINTASAIFERDGHGEHWKLHEGEVKRNGDVVTASGTLKGNLLLPKPDGTRESAPLEGDDVLPFEIRIEC